MVGVFLKIGYRTESPDIDVCCLVTFSTVFPMFFFAPRERKTGGIWRNLRVSTTNQCLTDQLKATPPKARMPLFFGINSPLRRPYFLEEAQSSLNETSKTLFLRGGVAFGRGVPLDFHETRLAEDFVEVRGLLSVFRLWPTIAQPFSCRCGVGKSWMTWKKRHGNQSSYQFLFCPSIKVFFLGGQGYSLRGFAPSAHLCVITEEFRNIPNSTDVQSNPENSIHSKNVKQDNSQNFWAIQSRNSKVALLWIPSSSKRWYLQSIFDTFHCWIG